jgi:hypothetical protein
LTTFNSSVFSLKVQDTHAPRAEYTLNKTYLYTEFARHQQTLTPGTLYALPVSISLCACFFFSENLNRFAERFRIFLWFTGVRRIDPFLEFFVRHVIQFQILRACSMVIVITIPGEYCI